MPSSSLKAQVRQLDAIIAEAEHTTDDLLRMIVDPALSEHDRHNRRQQLRANRQRTRQLFEEKWRLEADARGELRASC